MPLVVASNEVSVGRFAGRATRERRCLSLATLPMRMGGLGLRSATRMAPAAYWASWVDALHMVQERLPAWAQSIVVQLEAAAGHVGCPLLNTITGRLLCCASRCQPGASSVALVLGRPKSWSDAPPSLSSGLHQIFSERSSWRDSVCRCLFVSQVRVWIVGRRSGTAQSTLLPLRQVAHSSLSTRTHTRQSVPGGRSVSSLSTRSWWT